MGGLEESIWRLADAVRGSVPSSASPHLLLPLLAVRRFDQAGETAGKMIRALESGFAEVVVSLPERVRWAFDALEFERLLAQLRKTGALRAVLDATNSVDIGPARMTASEVSGVLRSAVRRLSGEAGAEHSTPEDVAALMAAVLKAEDDVERQSLTVHDPACGLGANLFACLEHGREAHPDDVAAGQDLNPRVLAVCTLPAAVGGRDWQHLAVGNALSEDHHPELRADYLVSSPPFGLTWKWAHDAVVAEHRSLGSKGRFGPGLPRHSDGTLLFLLHMLAKMRAPEDGGSRVALLSAGSPLWSGRAGQGESEIRRHLFENDLLEAVLMMPAGLLENTGIPTFLWVLANRKKRSRVGRVQIVDATEICQRLRPSEGRRRRQLTEADIEQVLDVYRECKEGPLSRLFENGDFAYSELSLERPLRLSFDLSDDGFAALEEDRRWKRLVQNSPEAAASIRSALRDLKQRGPWDDRAKWRADLEEEAPVIKEKKLRSALRAVEDAFGRRDAGAAVCTHRGVPEPDPKLRFRREVAGVVDAEKHFQVEIAPSAPDAWLSDSGVGHRIARLKHLGFALERELGRFKIEYRDCEVVPMDNVCSTIQMLSTERFRSPDLDVLDQALRRFGVSVEPNPERLERAYLAMFFSTDLGQRLLRSLAYGAISLRVVPEDLGALPVPVPSLEEQRELVSVRDQVEMLREELARLEAALAANPRNLARVNDTIQPMRRVLGALTDADEVRERVRAGESKRVEFKETFSLDVKKGTKEKYIEESALKTVVAFLNSDGGDLLIGVADDGQVLGLDREITALHKDSRDKFLLHVKNNLKKRIGEPAYPLMDQRIVEVDDTVVLWVRCEASEGPIFLDEEHFYVRTNPATDLLKGRKMHDYITTRFK